jgi:hypothetical protein
VKPGPAIAAALLAAPIASVAGLAYVIATHHPDDYRFEIANNAHVRSLGFPAPDPSRLEFLAGQIGSMIPIALMGTVIAGLANLVLGLPALYLSERLLGPRRPLQAAALAAAGIGAGVYLWSSMISPLRPLDPARFAEGAVFGGVAALAALAIYHRLASEPEPPQERPAK